MATFRATCGLVEVVVRRKRTRAYSCFVFDVKPLAEGLLLDAKTLPEARREALDRAIRMLDDTTYYLRHAHWKKASDADG